jgi:hypothetical protein
MGHHTRSVWLDGVGVAVEASDNRELAEITHEIGEDGTEDTRGCTGRMAGSGSI